MRFFIVVLYLLFIGVFAGSRLLLADEERPGCADPCPADACAEDESCLAVDTRSKENPEGCPKFDKCLTGKGVRCGRHICPKGYECCNESCGICVQPGNYCIDMFCYEKAKLMNSQP